MADILAHGAGAASGVAQYLEQMLAEQEMELRRQNQAETSRHNRSTEDYNAENMRLQTQLRSDAQGDRRATSERADADRNTNIALKSAEMQPIGADVDDASATAQMKAGVPRANYDWQPGNMGMTVAPTAEQPMGEEKGPKLAGYRWQGSQKDLTAQDRLELDQRRAAGTKEYQGRRATTAEDAERRQNEWGPPVVPIADPDAPGSFTYAPRGQAPGKAGPAPPAQRSQEISNEVSLDQLDRLEKMQKGAAGKMTGPIEGRARSIGQDMPLIPVDRDWSNFQAATSAFRNSVIKAITGAQMSEVEAKRIREQIPELSDKPEVWQAKAAQTRQNIADLNNRLRTKRAPEAAPTTEGKADLVWDGKKFIKP